MRPIDADSINWESVEEEHGTRTPAVVACQSLIQNAPIIGPFKDKSLEQLMDECFQRGYRKAVRHGKWIGKTDGDGDEVYICSECGEELYWLANYCPNCGAKMIGGKDDETD